MLFRTLLREVFHGALVLISNEDVNEAGLKNTKSSVVVKIWCWALFHFEKCVYLDPNHLVRIRFSRRSKSMSTLFPYELYGLYY